MLNLCVRRLCKESSLKAHELMVEIGDDLVDYDDDVLARSFNVYRLFLALRLSSLIGDTEAEYRRRARHVEPELLELHEQRNRAAWRGIAPSYDWVIPPPICDEEQF